MPRATVIKVPKAATLPPGNVSAAEWNAAAPVISASATREIDVRKFDHIVGASLIDRLNMAIAEAAPYRGRVVGVTGTQEIRPDPDTSQWIKAKSGVTLDLYDGTLKVANDAPPYDYLIASETPGARVERWTLRGGMIDQNPGGNVTGDIQFGIPNAKMARVARFVNFYGLTFDTVEMLYSGVNAISASSAQSDNVYVRDCTFRFQRGPSSTPGYDNSTLYIDSVGASIENNIFYSEIAEGARGAIETHGPGHQVGGNTSFAFETLVNLVAPMNSPLSPLESKATTLTGNAAYDANQAIRLWVQQQDALSGFVIADNSLHIAQIDWNLPSCGGIVGFASNTPWEGDMRDGAIRGNIIKFQPGDTRTTASNGTTLSGSVLTGIDPSVYGTTQNILIEGNTIIDCPGPGIMIGNTNAKSVSDTIMVRGNPIIDAGQNPNIDPLYRTALALRGDSSRVRFENNPITDTGTTSLKGNRSISVFVLTGTENVIPWNSNPVTTLSGLQMGIGIPPTGVHVFMGKKTVSFGTIAPGASAYVQFAIPGCRDTDRYTVQAQGHYEAGLDVDVTYAAPGVAQVRATNRTSAPITPVSRIYRVFVDPSHIEQGA